MSRIAKVRGGSGDVIEPKVGTRPQDNLYLAVNSEWIKNAKIPSDRSRTSSFDGIDVNVEKKMMKDFAAFADGKKDLPDVKDFDKAVDLYKIARDFDKRNSDGDL